MITSKQRAYLRSLASGIDSIIQVGKGGLSENLIKTVSDALEARELIKITILENCAFTPREIADLIAEQVSAEVVSVIGKKAVFYRESENHKTIEL